MKRLKYPVLLVFFLTAFCCHAQLIINKKIIKSPSLAVGVTVLSDYKGVFADYSYPLRYTSKARWYVSFQLERIEDNKVNAIDGNILFEQYKLTLNNASVGIAVYNKPITDIVRSFASVRLTYSYLEETTESNVFKDVHIGAASIGGGVEIRVSEKMFFVNSIQLGYREWFGETLPQIYEPEHIFGQLKFGIRYYFKKRIANFRG